MTLKCQTCGHGVLEYRRVYRLNGLLALAGYVLLIPSTLVLLWSGFLLSRASAEFLSSFGSGARAAQARTTLERAGLPQDVVFRVVNRTPISPGELAYFSAAQQDAVTAAMDMNSIERPDAITRASVFGLGAIVGFIASLLSAILGLLLTMKKSILQCWSCDAAVPAS